MPGTERVKLMLIKSAPSCWFVCVRPRCRQGGRGEYPEIDQSINRSIGQSVNQSIGQLVNWSIGQLVNRSIGQLVNWSISQSVNQSINQQLNIYTKFSTNHNSLLYINHQSKTYLEISQWITISLYINQSIDRSTNQSVPYLHVLADELNYALLHHRVGDVDCEQDSRGFRRFRIPGKYIWIIRIIREKFGSYRGHLATLVLNIPAIIFSGNKLVGS